MGGEIAWTLILPSSVIDVDHSYKNVRSGKATLAAEVDPEEADTELLTDHIAHSWATSHSFKGNLDNVSPRLPRGLSHDGYCKEF